MCVLSPGKCLFFLSPVRMQSSAPNVPFPGQLFPVFPTPCIIYMFRSPTCLSELAFYGTILGSFVDEVESFWESELGSL